MACLRNSSAGPIPDNISTCAEPKTPPHSTRITSGNFRLITRLGVADRIRTIQADLDQTWPALGPADLVWASASLHHMAVSSIEPGQRSDPSGGRARTFERERRGSKPP
ncbi:hypothetical protein Pth03_76190 [Planotetraspora thailandica]|uniref:Uncharacterized protein n=1 Tax=Planotetraspora thailandica TaxID=487172 RepID=A0A8J3Y1X3_9ACTN|nr:hypothetical protein Pth03_76190 [Planotetraspora thailandica]